MVVRFGSVTDAIASVRMFGKRGAPAWAGERLTFVCCSSARSVVLPAERIALASARSGTRS